MSGSIDDSARATFRAIADILIPAAEGMPAASEVDVHGAVLDRIIGLRPDLAERFFRGVRAAGGQDARAAAAALNATDPEALGVIGLVASAAYYMQPRVRELIGYPGQEKRPGDPDETPEYVANGMLQQVIDRGADIPADTKDLTARGEKADMSGRTGGARRDEVADVLIIGAGPSGAVAARYLAATGFSVVALEQGHWPDAADFPGRKREYELVAQKRWHPNPNMRDLPRDYPVETSASDINPLMYAAVGGSTTLYAGHWTPFLPSDFRVKTLDGIADDWPFTYEDLLPSLEEIEREVGVSGLPGNPAYPPQCAFPTPPLPIGKAGRKAVEGLDKLGWHWWPGTNAMPSLPYNGLNPCVRRGTCMTGCPEGAKSTVNITFWPHAIRSGARLVTGARVREIELNEQGLATGAIYIDESGRERRQRASVVIVCANGIGTPRLLLLSKSARFPDGLANRSGMVGRRLMMHPFAAVLGVFEEELDGWVGPFGQLVESFEFYETDQSRGFLRGAKWGAMPGGGPLGVTSFVGSQIFSAGEGARVEDAWGENLHKLVARRFNHSLVYGIIGEDLPEESNRVVLDPDLTDSDGVPAPKLLYRVSENSHAMLRFNVARCTEAVQAAGAIETVVVHQVRDTGWHLLGTCRMGENPETSVVDPWGRAHDVPNLFMFDGSVFPTSGGVNPTATIMSVALRQVRHLISERRLQEAA